MPRGPISGLNEEAKRLDERIDNEIFTCNLLPSHSYKTQL